MNTFGPKLPPTKRLEGWKEIGTKVCSPPAILTSCNLHSRSFAFKAADGGAIPFNTQFFHDEYDDGPGFDDVYDGDGDGPMAMGTTASIEPGEQDLLALTQDQTRRVRPELVNYARRAKRVDVRKLKENIWKGLDIITSDTPSHDEDGDQSMVS